MNESYLGPLGRSVTSQINQLMAKHERRVHRNPGNSSWLQNKLTSSIHSLSALCTLTHTLNLPPVAPSPQFAEVKSALSKSLFTLLFFFSFNVLFFSHSHFSYFYFQLSPRIHSFHRGSLGKALVFTVVATDK